MLREQKGYFPWIGNDPERFIRRNLKRWHRYHPHIFEILHDSFLNTSSKRHFVKSVLDAGFCDHPLFDLLMKALIRAEIRFISRFIPQRSHEERLTGNLVSEIDSAIFLTKDLFRKDSLDLYTKEKDIDFFYYDLSRGGKIEKATGADLGIIMLIDLPDYPFTVKSLILQAKKMNGTAQIDRIQYEKLKEHEKEASSYLFYDMDLRRSCSPLVMPVNCYPFSQGYDECQKAGNKSFSIKFDDAKEYGYPLSLFLIQQLPFEEIGTTHSSFENAFSMFRDLCYHGINKSDAMDFNGLLAIMSIGRTISFSTPHNEGLVINI